MSEFDKWADEKERWDGEHSEARPLARLAWDFQQARNEALEKAAMAVVNAYKPVSRNASAGPTALMVELAALLQEPSK